MASLLRLVTERLAAYREPVSCVRRSCDARACPLRPPLLLLGASPSPPLAPSCRGAGRRPRGLRAARQGPWESPGDSRALATGGGPPGTDREGFSGRFVREHGRGRRGTSERCHAESLVILKLPPPPTFPCPGLALRVNQEAWSRRGLREVSAPTPGRGKPRGPCPEETPPSCRQGNPAPEAAVRPLPWLCSGHRVCPRAGHRPSAWGRAPPPAPPPPGGRRSRQVGGIPG